jgi:hypothetical protein
VRTLLSDHMTHNPLTDLDIQLRNIWHQNRLPVVLRAGSVRPLVIRLPFDLTNRDWLRQGRRTIPEWLPRHHAWSIPKTWFEDTLRQLLPRYGGVYVIQPFKMAEKCAPACWNAAGAICECSCMGANHGSGEPIGRWHVVSETFAVRVDTREFSCRLLKGA